MLKKIIYIVLINITLHAQIFTVQTSQEFQDALNKSSGNTSDDVIILKKGIYSTRDNGNSKFMYSDNEEFDLIIAAEDGLKATDVVLDGNNSNMIMGISNSSPNAIVTIERLSFENAYNPTSCGALLAKGSSKVSIHNCIFKNNTTNAYANKPETSNDITWGGGGAIEVQGSSLEVKNSYFYNNRASGVGGAIFLKSGSLKVDGSKFEKNWSHLGGAIGSRSSLSDITNSEFIENSVSRYCPYGSDSCSVTDENKGGAIYGNSIDINKSKFIRNKPSAIFSGLGKDKSRVYNSLFQENNSTAIRQSGEYGYGNPTSAPLEVVNSKFYNQKYGITFNGVNGNATIINSIFNNHVTAIYATDLDMFVVNSIFSNNEKSIMNEYYRLFGSGSTTVKNCTFTNNSDISIEGSGLIMNSIFNNTASIDIKLTHSNNVLLNNYLNRNQIHIKEENYTYLFQKNMYDFNLILQSNYSLENDSILIDSGRTANEYLTYFNTLSKNYLATDINGTKMQGWFRDIGAVESMQSRCVEDIIYALNPKTKQWIEVYNTCDAPKGWIVSQSVPKDFLNLTNENSNTIVNIDELKEFISSKSSGWHLIGTTHDIYDLSILDNVEIAYLYRDNQWLVYTPLDILADSIQNNVQFFDVIYENEGFWIYKQ